MASSAKGISRRRFLATAAAATGSACLWNGIILGEGAKGANDRLAIGVVGVSGRGGDDLNETAAAGAEIVALCDVSEERAKGARRKFEGAKFFTDFRKMVEEKGIDAVVVGTPDHIHAVAAMAAIKTGRHVYCEKPLTRTVWEARMVTEAARREKRVTQMGTQIHNTGTNYRHVVKLIQGGAIGKVNEVHVWCGKDWGLQGWKRPAETPPVPAGFDWDLWLGPAPMRPYHPCYTEGGNWRRWWDFGGGTLADMACHYMDLPFWALDLKYPVKVSAEGPPPDPETAPLWRIIHWQFPARGDMPPVKFSWYDGGKRPALFEEKGKLPEWGDGVLFIGEKGMLIADYGGLKLLPEEKFKGMPQPEKIPEPAEHHQEWVDACKKASGSTADFGSTTCNFGYSGPLAETVLLGNVAFRLGKPFDWDAENLKASEAGAEPLIKPVFREGWSL